jgi:flagellar assembly factor FliW
VHIEQIGDVKVLRSQEIQFEQGLPGFEQYHQFTLLELELDLPIPVRLLKSLYNEHISLLVVNPFHFYPNYEWDLPDHVQQELRITTPEDMEVWSVIILPTRATDATINLLAPIIINPQHQIGRQLILHNSGYSNRHPLFVAEDAVQQEG